MAEYKWPEHGTATLLGTSPDRLDGIEKSTGTAKYSYDITRPTLLIAKALGCPHAHCKIKSIDLTDAQATQDVVVVKALKEVGNEILWQGDLLAVAAGESVGAVNEALAKIKIEYEMLPVFVQDHDLAAAEAAGRTKNAGGNVQLEKEAGDDVEDEAAYEEEEFKRLFEESAAVVEGSYGIHSITHMCLEPHGSTCEWEGNKLTAHLSTQNVSGTAAQFAGPLEITADDVTVHCDYIGGGFGSKFAADSWGVVCAQLARETKRPVKFMLDRDIELKSAGNRPSGFIEVKLGADKEGVVKVWDSKHWGTGGPGAGGSVVSQDVIPYVFNPANRRRRVVDIVTNTGPGRAWRAPNHPQGCAITQVAYDDVAAKLGLNSYDVFMKNLPSVSNGKAEVYAKEMEIAAKLMDWQGKWHPHGKGEARGSVVTGLGMAIHTWGGGGHNSSCRIKVHPDGGVEAFLGSQDLGTGTRTVIALVIADALGLPLDAVKVNIGSSKYPPSGPSGGSTTVGGVSGSSRKAALDVLDKLYANVAKKLSADAAQLEAKGGRIQVKDKPDSSVSWKEACATLGMAPLEVTASFERASSGNLSGSGVAGVQMAEVAVDKETGEVRMRKYVCVQDMGLIISRKTALSQIYGAVIMGIAYALFEERIMDPLTGAFVNAELADYKLPRLGDTGEIVIELYEPKEEYERGVIGLGEPPVIAPGAAISNAVCNALGVRVPILPMTPARVIEAIQKGGRA